MYSSGTSRVEPRRPAPERVIRKAVRVCRGGDNVKIKACLWRSVRRYPTIDRDRDVSRAAILGLTGVHFALVLGAVVMAVVAVIGVIVIFITQVQEEL